MAMEIGLTPSFLGSFSHYSILSTGAGPKMQSFGNSSAKITHREVLFEIAFKVGETEARSRDGYHPPLHILGRA